MGPHLPVPIPSVCGRGVSGAGYPFCWSVCRWLGGSTATHADIVDPVQFAEQLADFLVSLRSIDAADGPQPGVHDWYRGGTLLTYDATLRRSLAALAAPWNGEDVWFHDDLAEGNVLLSDGQLAAVIDFGICGVGDPSYDLAVAWTRHRG